MYRNLVSVGLMFFLSVELQASNRFSEFDNFESDAIAALERAEEEHNAKKRGGSERDSYDDQAMIAAMEQAEEEYNASKRAREQTYVEDSYKEGFFEELDLIEKTYLAKSKPVSAVTPVAVKRSVAPSPSTVLQNKQKALPHKVSGRKLFGEEGHLDCEGVHHAAQAIMTPMESDEISNHPLAPEDFSELVNNGTLLKLLASAYKGNLNEKANIFFPRHTIKYDDGRGSFETKRDFFRTPKGEVCVFASGGSQNRWEKTVAKVFGVFFNEKIKIIRAHWMHKHLREMNIGTFNEADYKDKETELHSELFYDLFFKHFFINKVRTSGIHIDTLVVDAYSWWEICDTCEERFQSQRDLCQDLGIRDFQCRVTAAQKYSHTYVDTILQNSRVPAHIEQEAWNEIWSKVKHFMDLYPEDTPEKRRFWTKTADGLELCKWIGQALVENKYRLDGRYADPDERGDLLKFFNELSEDEGDMTAFQEFIYYLSDVNWDLSCWYSGRYPALQQSKWKKHMNQVVMPHFDWHIVSTYRDETAASHCEMCGQKGIIDISTVYHPKYKVSSKLLDAGESNDSRDDDWQKLSKDEQPRIFSSHSLRSLDVGSECVKFMQMTKGEIVEWRESNPLDVTEAIAEENATRHEQYDELDRVAAEDLYKVIRKGCEENKGTVTTRYIAKHSTWENAKDMQPHIDILLKEGRIEKAGRGKYKVLK